jgi:hypothetical protein
MYTPNKKPASVFILAGFFEGDLILPQPEGMELVIKLC